MSKARYQYKEVMKNKITLLISGAIILMVSSCDPQPISESKSVDLEAQISGTYKAPVFTDDRRVEKIEKIIPELKQLIEDHAKTSNIPGVAFGLVVDNDLIYTSSYGVSNIESANKVSSKSSFRIASMTKSFTAMAIMKLRDEGRLSLHDPVDKYIPQMSKQLFLTNDAPYIDIESLLTMTAGFPEDNPWGDRQLDEPDEMLSELIEEGLSFSNPASYRYEYSNTGYAMLGKIISIVSGIPYQEYIKENILLPLGMHHTYWEYENIPEDQFVAGYRWEDENWKPEPILHDGSFGAMGGLITSIEDFSKYVSFHLSAWPPRNEDDNGPVKRSTLREMHTAQYASLDSKARNAKDEPCPLISGYGYGLRIVTDCNEHTQVSHGGALPGYGSNYIFFPEYGVGMMAFGNLTYTSPYPAEEIKDLLFNIANLEPRKLPASDILMERQEQVVNMITSWDPKLEAEILAENFYLDKSRDQRKAEITKELGEAGTILDLIEINAFNQLRGIFTYQCENAILKMYFTLSPESDPKVQSLYLLIQ